MHGLLTRKDLAVAALAVWAAACASSGVAPERSFVALHSDRFT